MRYISNIEQEKVAGSIPTEDTHFLYRISQMVFFAWYANLSSLHIWQSEFFPDNCFGFVILNTVSQKIGLLDFNRIISCFFFFFRKGIFLGWRYLRSCLCSSLLRVQLATEDPAAINSSWISLRVVLGFSLYHFVLGEIFQGSPVRERMSVVPIFFHLQTKEPNGVFNLFDMSLRLNISLFHSSVHKRIAPSLSCWQLVCIDRNQRNML